MEQTEQQSLHVRNLGTKSVTLYPYKAEIKREISVTLEPGINKWVITGLSPTVDESSIKLEGVSGVTVVSLTTELVTNTERYEDVYPSPNHEAETNDEDEVEDIHEILNKEFEAQKHVETLVKQIETLKKKRDHEYENVESAREGMTVLNTYSSSVTGDDRPKDICNFLEQYRNARSQLHNHIVTAENALEHINSEILRDETKLAKERKQFMSGKAAQIRAHRASEDKIRHEKLDKVRLAAELRAKRLRFWPSKVYQVCVTLESESVFATPSSSRRNSTDSLVKIPSAQDTKEGTSETPPTRIESSFMLTYISYGAYWSPRYDLSLNTTTSTGTLDFCADLRNTTSEIWHDTKITLSTSLTSSCGVNGEVPKLDPWNLGFAKSSWETTGVTSVLQSTQEMELSTTRAGSDIPAEARINRAELFGLDVPVLVSMPRVNMFSSTAKSRGTPLGGSQSQPVPGGLRRSRGGAPSFPSAAATAAVGHTGLFGVPGGGASANPALMCAFQSESHAESEAATPNEDSLSVLGRAFTSDSRAVPPPPPMADSPLELTDSAFETNGLTTTYDLPGLKTLEQSFMPSKQCIARIVMRGMKVNHEIVPKLQLAVYMTVELKNQSHMTILKGPGGLTLDGSFIGPCKIPRVAPNETFMLPLGIDPAVEVKYAPPTVKKSQSGYIAKEMSELYERSITLKNNKAVNLEVMIKDQIPVSSDASLRIETVTPGCKIGGESVRTGQDAADGVMALGRAVGTGVAGPTKTGSKKGEEWGSATARVKKDGEVNWVVELRAGRSCELGLEYELCYPMGEIVVQV